MTVFHGVTLEITRPGPSHNQLLSPLTRYTALCGESAPVNFSIELEQHQLLDKISRLRYIIPDGEEARVVAEKSRQAAVDDMGQEMGKILGKLQNLLFEQGRSLGQSINDQSGKDSNEHMIHLRLVSSASELANLPFEIAISPPATPAEGKHMLQDLNLPVVLTREIRRTRPIPIAWDRKLDTKILVIAAQPGFSTVPLKNHIRALRKGLEPWIGWPPVGEEGESGRVDQTKARIRVLKDASIQKVYDICSKEQFTHIHILAHGGSFERSGEKRYGVILCDDKDPTKAHHVGGQELAQALQAEHKDGNQRSTPVMVMLATCDSGAQGSVLTPGGSLAYDLHVAGIPWVLASQFPLSKHGSTILTRELYPRIWRGDDPRKALFEVRRILSSHVDRMHDWASLTIYASLPPNFDAQITQFFENQTKAAVETAMKRADNISKALAEDSRTDTVAKLGETKVKALEAEVEITLKKVQDYLEFWKTRLPSDKDMSSRLSRAECYGICGSVNKRIALLYKPEIGAGEIEADEKKNYIQHLIQALCSYDQAIDQWATDQSKYHWAATQYLSLKAVLYWESQTKDRERKKYWPDDRDYARFAMAKELASKDSMHAEENRERAWACGTLAELEMLSKHYEASKRRQVKTIIKAVKEHCSNLIQHVGPDDFAVNSTRRQFKRYLDYWGDTKDNEWLRDIAGEAVSTLSAD
jgi:hypothetical protein